MDEKVKEYKFPWLYFGLVFLFAMPFYVFGPLVDRMIRGLLPINLPFSALQAVCPVLAALIVVRREKGPGAGKELLKRTFDFKKVRNNTWIVTAFLLVPVMLALEYGISLLMGTKMPNAQVQILLAIPFFLIFFIFAATEELGWTGYAIDRLMTRWSALGSAVFIGIIWQLFHLIPLMEAPHTASWVIFQILGMLPLRIILAWLYLAGGKSVFLAIVLHTMSNVSEFLFPNFGSYYDPMLSFGIFLAAALIVVSLWGPRTLARYRFSRHTEGEES